MHGMDDGMRGTGGPGAAIGTMGGSGATSSRAHERFVPLVTTVELTFAGGERRRARIVNVSAGGVAVEASFGSLAPTDVVRVGSKAVRSGRRIRLGAVLLFERPLDPRRCGPDLVL